MEIAFKPPVLMPLIFGAVVLVAALAVLLKKMSMVRKVLGLGITVVVCGLLTFFLYRTTHLVADDAGLRMDTYGRQQLAWTEVTSARLVENLAASPWAPKVRTGGTSIGDFQSGWFKLANGLTGFLVVEQRGEALVIEGAGKVFVLAPKGIEELAAVVARHVTVTREGGAS